MGALYRRADVGFGVGPSGVTVRPAAHVTHFAWTDMTGLRLRRAVTVFDHRVAPAGPPRSVLTPEQVAEIAALARAAGVPGSGALTVACEHLADAAAADQPKRPEM